MLGPEAKGFRCIEQLDKHYASQRFVLFNEHQVDFPLSSKYLNTLRIYKCLAYNVNVMNRPSCSKH